MWQSLTLPKQCIVLWSGNDDNTDRNLSFTSPCHTCCPLPLAYGPVFAAVSPRQAIAQVNTLMHFTAAFLPTATPCIQAAAPTRYVPYAGATQHRELCQALRQGCCSIPQFPRMLLCGGKRGKVQFPLCQGAAIGSLFKLSSRVSGGASRLDPVGVTDSRIGTVWQEYLIERRIPEAKKEGLHPVHMVDIRVNLERTERDI